MNATSECPCKSGQLFDLCCKPFLDRSTFPTSPEQLMRSRYTAYHQKDFQYVYDTYSEDKQKVLSVDELARNSTETKWLNLVIKANPTHEQVEFVATYQESGQFFTLHENSRFIKEQERWKYHDGVIFNDSGKINPGRNDLCPCGSNKKFKKCCG